MSTKEETVSDQVEHSLPVTEFDTSKRPSRFDSMFGRMNGTMTVVGDIVGPDPELWSCERE